MENRSSYTHWFRSAWLIAAVALLSFATSSASAQTTSGTRTWGGWSFGWSVDASSGLNITNVTFNGTRYITRMNMPVIRVQYDTGASPCGPFMDRLGTGNIVPDSTSFVRIAEINGRLFVWIVAQISAYALEQQYIFNTNGRIDTRLFSSGLQCSRNHRHHPYWRIDADVGDTVNDEIKTRYTDGRILWYANEFNRNKLVSPAIADWRIVDKPTQRQVIITPGTGDGSADSFASFDFYGRRYHGGEGAYPWASGVSGFADQGDLVLPSNNNEVIGPADSTIDVLGFYVAHLNHLASAGATQWIAVGPSLLMQ
jgi:hypothetical protein